MKSYIALLMLIVSVVSITQAQNQPANLNDWRKVNACGVIFTLPPDVQEVKSYPIDSCVKHYRGEDIDINLDVIYSPANFRSEEFFRRVGSDEPEFLVREMQIANVRSLVATYYQTNVPKEMAGLNYLSKLLVPYIGKDKRGLMMWVYSKTPEGQVIAQRIFESILPEKRK